MGKDGEGRGGTERKAVRRLFSSPSGDCMGLFQVAVVELLRSDRILVYSEVNQQGLLIDWTWVMKQIRRQG